VEQRVAAAIREINAEEAARKKEAEDLTAQRGKLRAGIVEDTLDTYDRIARAHGGIALAEAREEICQVCLIHIRPQTFAEVRRNEQIHYCESCHRILYYVAAPANQQPVSTP